MSKYLEYNQWFAESKCDPINIFQYLLQNFEFVSSLIFNVKIRVEEMTFSIENMKDFCVCCLGAPRPTLCHYRDDSIITNHYMLAIFDSKVTGALWREFGNVSPAERLVMFELATFRFDYKAWTHKATLQSSCQISNLLGTRLSNFYSYQSLHHRAKKVLHKNCQKLAISSL